MLLQDNPVFVEGIKTNQKHTHHITKQTLPVVLIPPPHKLPLMPVVFVDGAPYYFFTDPTGEHYLTWEAHAVDSGGNIHFTRHAPHKLTGLAAGQGLSVVGGNPVFWVDFWE